MISALDEDERARVDADDDYTLIITDVPYKEEDNADDKDSYGTVDVYKRQMIGFSVTTIIAGAGVVSLAVAFGAQSIVQDLMSGIFIVRCV